MTTPAGIPTIDLGDALRDERSAQRSTARAVDRAFRDCGFMVIEGHGVSNVLVTDAWTMARRFFDLPLDEKLAVSTHVPGNPRGYLPINAETLTKSQGVESAPDPKECFSSGQPDGAPAHLSLSPGDHDFFFGDNIWPSTIPEFSGVWLAYYRAMGDLAGSILSLCAIALSLPADYFQSSFDHHASALRALNYPPAAGESGGARARAGAHSDYGSLTILKPDPDVGGLEIRLPSGEWVAAPDAANGFVVNVGDLLARWSNDRWRSTMHRVTGAEEDSRRQSIAYFQNPNFDAEIRCLPGCASETHPTRYPPVQAGDYLRDRFTSAL